VLFAGFTQLAHAGRSELIDGYLLVPRVDVDGLGPLELRFSVEFDGEYFFVLEAVNEASSTEANSGEFEPERLTIEIYQTELPGGELFSVLLGLVSDAPVVIFNLLEAVHLNPESPDPDPGNGSYPGDPERGRSTYESQCAICHGAGGSGGVAPALTSDVPLAELIETIAQTMPLDDVTRCDNDCAADVAAFILTTFVDPPDDLPALNVKTLHRLNRTEFNNTIRDLLGTNQQPADNFPADDIVFGFDNIAAVLSLSPLHVELYEQAAWNLAEALVSLESSPGLWSLYAQDSDCSVGGATGEYWNLWSNGSCSMRIPLPVDGTRRLTAWVSPMQAGPDLVQSALMVDGSSVLTTQVAAASGSFEEIQTTAQISGGTPEIGVAFLNDYYNPDLAEDRNLLVDWFQV
jgi:mono/diheme cytochrome c family protein